jgi:hypothetical protein
LPVDGKVDVEVTAMTRSGRKITRVANVDPNKLPRRVLVVKVSAIASGLPVPDASFDFARGSHRDRPDSHPRRAVRDALGLP